MRGVFRLRMPKSDPTSTKNPRKSVDWEAVERDYRIGLKGLREMGKEHGVSPAGILKRAKRDGWARDLSARIKAKADALVNSASVNAEVNADTAATERELVDANATVLMKVRLKHRKDIARAQKLAMNLLGELEQTAEAIPLIERLEALVCKDLGLDGAAAINRQVQLKKILELGTRTATMKMAADIMTKLIALEREAFSLDNAKDKDPEKEGPAEQIANLLRQIDGAGTGLPAHHANPA